MKLLIACVIKNAGPWLHEMLGAIDELTYPRWKTRYAFLEGMSSDGTYETLRDHVEAKYNGVWLRRFDLDVPNRFTRLATLRNKLIDEALTDENYVLMIDGDIIRFPPNIIQKLLEHRVHVVAPLVKIEGTQQFYDTLAFIHKNKNFSHLKPYCSGITHNRHYFEVDSVGSCYLVDAEVYKAGVRYAGGGISEQVLFCMRAREKGFKIWVDPRITVWHANLPKYGRTWH